MTIKAKILITGSTGKVGSEVRRQLQGRKVPFRALVHSKEKAALVTGPGVEPVVGDFDRPETLPPALMGIEKLFLLSGSDLKQVERETTLLDLAKHAGVKQVVKLSVMGAALDSPLSLARWHAQVEKKLETTGMIFTHLRPNYFMQNFFGSVASIMEQGVFYGSYGDSRISMIDAGDIASVAVRCLLRSGCENKAFDLTGPEAISQNEIASHLSAALGRTIRYVNVSLDISRENMLKAGMPAWYVDALLDLTRSFLEGYGAKVTSAVPDITGKAAGTFQMFARHFAEVIKQNERKAA